MGASLTELGSKLAGLMFIWGTIQQLFPQILCKRIESVWTRLEYYLYPCVQITINELTNGKSNEIYGHVDSYLGTKSVDTGAKYLKAEKSENSKSFAVILDEGEEIIDEFEGATFCWRSHNETFDDNNSQGSKKTQPSENKSYTITFNKQHREIVTGKYLKHVIEEGRAIEFKNKKQRIYCNDSMLPSWLKLNTMWKHINFEHPATFDTLAMDPKKKEEIINDLVAFTKGKDYYSKVGKAWKRGYLLYGPPGTGKSTMIAAIANYLNYDIYDLELTSVKDNLELKKLLMETTSKSIIVIEDIDCSVDLTGKRKKAKKNKKKDDSDSDSNSDSDSDSDSDSESTIKLTLSGLLNFIDGIWSACGEERIIIFTTNHVDKLDPALIRRGRMDMHIEMSYCRYEAFKVLAKNYLGIDTHPLFQEIEPLLEEVNMSPCDVAESLILKNTSGGIEICLNNLILAFKDAKEKAIQLQESKEAREKEKQDSERVKEEKPKKNKKLSTKFYGRFEKLFR